MNQGCAHSWALPASCPGVGLNFTPPGPGLLPPALTLPSQPGQAWSPPAPSLTFQFSVVQELRIGHCRERRGRGTGSEPGREGDGGEGQSLAGRGWAAQPGSLLSVQSKLVLP